MLTFGYNILDLGNKDGNKTPYVRMFVPIASSLQNLYCRWSFSSLSKYSTKIFVDIFI